MGKSFSNHCQQSLPPDSSGLSCLYLFVLLDTNLEDLRLVAEGKVTPLFFHPLNLHLFQMSNSSTHVTFGRSETCTVTLGKACNGCACHKGCGLQCWSHQDKLPFNGLYHVLLSMKALEC